MSFPVRITLAHFPTKKWHVLSPKDLSCGSFLAETKNTDPSDILDVYDKSDLESESVCSWCRGRILDVYGWYLDDEGETNALSSDKENDIVVLAAFNMLFRGRPEAMYEADYKIHDVLIKFVELIEEAFPGVSGEIV